MRVLIIGGTNFVGPYVVRQLVEMGHAVTVFHRGETEAELLPNVNHLRGNRYHLDKFRGEFEQIAPEIVVDMIPYMKQDAQAIMTTFRGIAQRVVAISSMDVYRAYGIFLGLEAGPLEPLPLTENSSLRQAHYPFREMPERPLNAPADYEKILVEQVIRSDPKLPGTVVRLPMVYGPSDPLDRLFPYLQRMDANRPAIVLEERIAQWRSPWGYVENVAYAIALAVNHQRAAGRIYHVAEPKALTMAELLLQIGQIVGWKGEIVTVTQEDLPAEKRLALNLQQDLVVDSTRIRQELNYTEIVPLEAWLQRTINWQRSHPPQELSPWAAPELLDYATEDQILAAL